MRTMTINMEKFDQEVEKYLEGCFIEMSDDKDDRIYFSELSNMDDEESMSFLIALAIHNLACKCEIKN